MKQQYHIRKATDIDQKAVEDIFISASARFGLVDTMMSSLLQGTICNYSEGLGWGFGLGAWRLYDLICVGFNHGKSSIEPFPPVFGHIVDDLMRIFGNRVILAAKSEEVDFAAMPHMPMSEEHRTFFRKLLNRS